MGRGQWRVCPSRRQYLCSKHPRAVSTRPLTDSRAQYILFKFSVTSSCTFITRSIRDTRGQTLPIETENVRWSNDSVSRAGRWGRGLIEAHKHVLNVSRSELKRVLSQSGGEVCMADQGLLSHLGRLNQTSHRPDTSRRCCGSGARPPHKMAASI